jgi:PAS domain S-box-containing protein
MQRTSSIRQLIAAGTETSISQFNTPSRSENKPIPIQTIIDCLPDNIWVKDVKGRFVVANKSTAVRMGFSGSEALLGKTDIELCPAETAGEYSSDEKGIFKSGNAMIDKEEFVIGALGERTWISTTKVPLRNDNNEIFGLVGISRDVTERKKEKEELHNASLYARNLIEATLDPLMVLDLNGNIVDVNEASLLLFGISRDAAIGSDFTLYVAEQAAAQAALKDVRGRGRAIDFPLTVRHASGDERDVLYRATLFRNANGEAVGVVATGRDVTEQKQAERKRAFEAAALSAIQQASPDGILLVDPQKQILSRNQRFLEMWGLLPEGAESCDDESLPGFISAEMADAACFLAGAEEIDWRANAPIHDELRLEDGRIFERNSSAVCLASGADLGRVWFFRDITWRKEAETALRRLNRILRMLVAADQALLRANSEQELLDDMCRVVVDAGGYTLAFVGFPEMDESRTVRVVARFGKHPEFVGSINIRWAAETEWGRGVCGSAIRTGRTHVSQDIDSNPEMAPWRAEMLRLGFKSSIALPLRNGGEVLGCLTLYSGEADTFGSEEVALLEQLAANLSYGIYVQRDRVESDRAAQTLLKSFRETVEALAVAVETRDAHTAGHQRRVAELAAAISRELGLSEQRIEGVYFAGLIHDIGKISVPAEILNKPGELSPLEYQLIQTHPQVGHNIIRGINFPWPIGQLVLQHHERFDGSGYPNQLKGDEILVEARILAVADVLDALLSNRPYRPTLGIDVVLNHLKSGKGTLYDPVVVDACINVVNRTEPLNLHSASASHACLKL